MRRGLARWVIALAIPLLVDQIVLYVALGDDEFLGEPIAPFDPPLFHAAQVESVQRFEAWLRGEGELAGQMEHDAVLGWAPRPGRGDGEFRYDSDGARIAPGARPVAATRRLFVFGDSFTHGDEVAAGESWPALLGALQPTVEVRNFGVSGYGIDQALLRCRQMLAKQPADEVWLGFVPAAALRVLNLYGPVLRHDDGSISFKPRFVLSESEGLVPIANPVADPARVLAVLRDQRAFMDEVGVHEFFVQRQPAAYVPHFTSAWHYSALSRILLTRLERGGRAPEHWLADPSSELSRLLVELIVTMHREVVATGARFRLVVLPDGRSLRRRGANGGVGYWEQVCRAVSERGVEVIDLSAPLLEAGVDTSPQTPRYWAPLGHYSAHTNGLVAAKLGPLLTPR